ncbi:glycoside hydrolase family 47 protein [Polychaeton citri CBS 116435]|uniref:alpha-1,2-Mannosidase n=1 Tax=Polychaeton citri CBS 116435 TaxID=1314669 RepID=A0A9P4QE76_9PEZI|nr:glycoside hydrolase family 47 protein [Polychaeton citri CBS 116435]
MYKDKPFSYPTSDRRSPWFRRRKTVGLVLGAMAFMSWWFGILSPLSYFVSDNSTSADSSSGKSSGQGSWFGSSSKNQVNWADRADAVRDAFKLSWAGYEKHAWGYDEFRPESKGKKLMTPNGLGWIIVDALDTMMLMNLTEQLAHARQWIHQELSYDQDHDVSTFETTIRMLGGLLSAHYLSTEFGGKYAPVKDDLSEDMYVEKATDLADRLLGAYESKSGVPYASVNLHTRGGIPSHDDGGASSTAEATSVQLEMKYLAKLTGEVSYWTSAEHVMKVVDDNNAKDGLLPIFIYADNGAFRGNNIRLGSRGDSYYEYLIKQYLQTSSQESVYKEMWDESMDGVKKHLLTYSYPSNFTVLAERPNGLSQDISPKMDHLVCFMPGTIAVAATGGLPLEQARKLSTWGPKQEEDIKLAGELMKTCWGMYKVTAIGLAPEIAHFNLHEKPLMYNDFPQDAKPVSPEFNPNQGLGGANEANEAVGRRDYIVKHSDSHNLQRPETVESLFYMWRVTGDEKYREWGWEMFRAFAQYTAVEDGTGYTSINDVMQIPPPTRDNMESFWLAETLKYLYLLFSPTDILPLTDVVFNTEAHPFPRFQMGKLFSTGWKRKARDSEGNIVPDAPSEHVERKTLTMTRTLGPTSATVAGVTVNTDAAAEVAGDVKAGEGSQPVQVVEP